MKKISGFTLLEILVALMIFAIMGVLAAASLHTIIRVHRSLKIADHNVMQLMTMMTLVRRDISEVIDRPILDDTGNVAPPFFGSDTQMEFTRTGLLNPFGVSRASNMQRIGYQLKGDKLVRLTWDSLDQAPHAQPEVLVLLDHVQSLKWQFITKNGQTSPVWPVPQHKQSLQHTNNTTAPPPLPNAVLMVMHV